jgi:hypothetical protein
VKSRAAHLALASLSLFVAAVLYLGARQGMRIHVWANAWMPSVVHALRATLGRLHLPGWVRYSLPDALWQLAFCLVMLAVWQGAPRSRRQIFFCVLPAGLGAAIELGQKAGLVEGVFDPVDLVLSLAAAGVALALSSTCYPRASRRRPSGSRVCLAGSTRSSASPAGSLRRGR